MVNSQLMMLGTHLAGVTVTTRPDPNKVTPGFAGFAVVFLLACATILLVRSMTKHMRNVRYSPDPSDIDLERTGDVVHDQGVHPGGE